MRTHPGSESSYNEKEILAHTDIITLPLVFSSCPVCCEPTYVGSGRHLLISLQIWAWWDWHHHNSNSHVQGSAGSAQTRSSQFMMILRCLALVVDFQAGLSLECFWGSGPDAVCWKMPESYLESDGREPWQGSVSWALGSGDHSPWGHSSLAWWHVHVCTNWCLTSARGGRPNVGNCLQKSMRL